MRIGKMIELEWKNFSRSASFGKGMLTKVFLGIVAINFFVSFLILGAQIYYVIDKEVATNNPLEIINGFMINILLIDLFFRYMMQRLPVINIKPLLLLNVRKTKIVNIILLKSVFSFFNIVWVFFFVPFSIVLFLEGFNTVGVFAWCISVLLLILSSNFLNFLINIDKKVLAVVVLLSTGIVLFQYFSNDVFIDLGRAVFGAFYKYPFLVAFPLLLLLVSYFFSFKKIKELAYLDGVIKESTKKVKAINLSFLDVFGDLSPLIKKEVRLIWRNKRAKTTLFIAFLVFILGLVEIEETFEMYLVYSGILVTAGFIMGYGQFIPAWDCAYYKMLMTQKITYHRYLEAKWVLFAVFIFFNYLVSIPVIFLGVDKFAVVTAGAIFNIGWNIYFTLFFGGFNRKYIDISATGFANYQGVGAAQILIILPTVVLPVLMFWCLRYFLGFYLSLLMISFIGILGIVLKKKIMNVIEELYKKNKYITVKAFSNK